VVGRCSTILINQSQQQDSLLYIVITFIDNLYTIGLELCILYYIGKEGLEVLQGIDEG